MANPHKGEFEFEVDGKTYIMRFGTNELCDLEDKIGKSAIAAMMETQDMTTIHISTIRALMWAGLHGKHPEIDLRAAGNLIASVGGLVKALEIITQAFSRSFPDPGGEARPLAGAAQTTNGAGTNS